MYRHMYRVLLLFSIIFVLFASTWSYGLALHVFVISVCCCLVCFRPTK